MTVRNFGARGPFSNKNQNGKNCASRQRKLAAWRKARQPIKTNSLSCVRNWSGHETETAKLRFLCSLTVRAFYILLRSSHRMWHSMRNWDRLRYGKGALFSIGKTSLHACSAADTHVGEVPPIPWLERAAMVHAQCDVTRASSRKAFHRNYVQLAPMQKIKGVRLTFRNHECECNAMVCESKTVICVWEKMMARGTFNLTDRT